MKRAEVAITSCRLISHAIKIRKLATPSRCFSKTHCVAAQGVVGHIAAKLYDRAGFLMLKWLSELPERYGRPQSKVAYIPQIDGLRALAILSVILWHLGLRIVRQVDELNTAGYAIRSPYYSLPHGEIGVALFFVVSGFVIAQPFLARPISEWQVGRYYWRRIHRIYPPFFIVLVLGLITLLLTQGGTSLHLRNPSTVPLWQSFIASALYMHGLIFNSASRINPPIWSLEVEIQFYLISPLLMWAYVVMGSRRNRICLGITAIVAVLASIAALHDTLGFDGRFRFGLPVHLHLFLVGIILADLGRASDPLNQRATYGFDCILAASIGALIGDGLYLTRVDDLPPGGLTYFFSQSWMAMATIGVYFGAMRGRIGQYVLARPWVCLTGTACYSIYLLHVGIIQLVDDIFLRRLHLHELAALWIIWTPILCCAVWSSGIIFYCIVERRFMNRRFS